ncbi:MAG TPA: DUF4349 domain-containing protein [Candidatus Limnocylindria bacterium]|nr:DUF4349 domain-containing protein [Candidatus Limnocylindria bacterium]
MVLILAIVLAACAGAAGTPAGEARGVPAGAVPDSDANAPGEQDGNGTRTGGNAVSFEDLASRQIVKTGEVTIEVEKVSTAVGAIRAMALELGGYVGGSQAGTDDDAATLTLRIPAERFDDALTRVHELDGQVTAEATREQDVTGQAVDLEARIRNLEASEAQYRALLNRASRIEDILTIQSRLDEVRGQVEQLQAQLDQLSELAALATLTVTLVPAAARVEQTTAAWDPGAIFDSAVAALVGLGQAVAAAAIWLVILGLPLALFLGVVLWIGLRAAPAFRRRVSPAVDHPGAPME